MALALYRKYRPKKLEEIVGQEMNVLLLKNAARLNRIGHAYLLHGPRGTGKTTTARIIAKLLNCERRHEIPSFRKVGEACNECLVCREIDSNASLDVVEIDAASNRGIEEIRNLKESITTAPAAGRYKVYIIDEVHMLTPQAFNALLKTLEEPPPHAVLVLATTEYEKLPATITSRVQRFLFKRIPKVKMIETLTAIAKEEQIPIEPPAIELIAAAAEGSFRDALSLLDQLSSLVPERVEQSEHADMNRIDLATAELLTGRVGLRKVDELADLILKNDLKAALSYLGGLYEEGHNVIQFTKDLIHYLRKILSLKLSPALEDVFKGEFTADELLRVKQLGVYVSPQKAIPLIRSLIRAYSEMRYSPFQTIPLEIALIENLSQNQTSDVRALR